VPRSAEGSDMKIAVPVDVEFNRQKEIMMKSKILFGTLTAMAMLSAGSVFAMNGSSDKTQKFIEKATMGNQFEILSSQEAVQRAHNPKVKEFARKMIEDHTQVEKDMRAALKEANMSTAVTEPVVLDSKHQKTLDNLKKEDAKSFDEDYIDAQDEAHEDAVELFRDYSKDGDSVPLKAFATKTLPTLESHKQQVDTLDDELDKNGIFKKNKY
jgi:putative membrane protein